MIVMASSSGKCIAYVCSRNFRKIFRSFVSASNDSDFFGINEFNRENDCENDQTSTHVKTDGKIFHEAAPVPVVDIPITQREKIIATNYGTIRRDQDNVPLTKNAVIKLKRNEKQKIDDFFSHIPENIEFQPNNLYNSTYDTSSHKSPDKSNYSDRYHNKSKMSSWQNATDAQSNDGDSISDVTCNVTHNVEKNSYITEVTNFVTVVHSSSNLDIESNLDNNITTQNEDDNVVDETKRYDKSSSKNIPVINEKRRYLDLEKNEENEMYQSVFPNIRKTVPFKEGTSVTEEISSGNIGYINSNTGKKMVKSDIYHAERYGDFTKEAVQNPVCDKTKVEKGARTVNSLSDGNLNLVNFRSKGGHEISLSETIENERTRSHKKKLSIFRNIDFERGTSAEPSTAYDVAMKLRVEKAKGMTADGIPSSDVERKVVPGKNERLDSKGYRVMRGHMIDFSKLTRAEIVDLLHDSIIYNDFGIVAIDKPYGLASHGGPGQVASVGQQLDELALKLDPTGETKLHLIHRLDKETTGVMVLAKTLETMSRLRWAFVNHDVIKRYLIITKGVPSTQEGIIDIPMREQKFGNTFRMTLHPDYNSETRLVMKKSYLKTAEAVTRYKVLDSVNESALVECQPETGKKHQIRVHMAFGLDTPILGDHKYSHFTTMAPQKLNASTLNSLGIRQSKVRDVPMHLHASNIILPNFVDGRNVKITATPPRFFLKNMSRLKLKNPFFK